MFNCRESSETFRLLLDRLLCLFFHLDGHVSSERSICLQVMLTGRQRTDWLVYLCSVQSAGVPRRSISITCRKWQPAGGHWWPTWAGGAENGPPRDGISALSFWLSLVPYITWVQLILHPSFLGETWPPSTLMVGPPWLAEGLSYVSCSMVCERCWWAKPVLQWRALSLLKTTHLRQRAGWYSHLILQTGVSTGPQVAGWFRGHVEKLGSIFQKRETLWEAFCGNCLTLPKVRPGLA